jgi:anti-sigma factor RsiW
MSDGFRCDDKETLVAYLYGEVDEDVRRDIERHLLTCAACTRETEGLQMVRQDLQSWVPPEPALEFTIVPRSQSVPPAAVLTSPRWSALRAVPTWAGVAAAALFLGVGASLANIQVRSTSDGMIVTTGWMQPAAVVPTPAPTIVNDEWRSELAALAQSLRSEMAAQRAVNVDMLPRAAAAPRAVGLDVTSTNAVLRRVREMLDESEERQRQEMAGKFVQAQRLWTVQRQTDLININRSFGSLQNRTLAVQANQQEISKTVDHLRRVSFTPPNQ